MLDHNGNNSRLTQIQQNTLLFERRSNQRFPLPSWERVRGSYQAWSPSPHSSPVKGEEASKLTALPSLFCAAFWRCTQSARFRRFWLLLVALVICGLGPPEHRCRDDGTGGKDRPKGCAAGSALVVSNQPIAVFRASFGGLSAQERAAQATERIQALPLGSESAEIKVEPIEDRRGRGCRF